MAQKQELVEQYYEVFNIKEHQNISYEFHWISTKRHKKGPNLDIFKKFWNKKFWKPELKNKFGENLKKTHII